MENNSKIEEVLLKVALGYQVAEVTEEYAEVDGKLRLTKRKKTKKDVPPDLKAMQMLLNENGGAIETLSDEDLEREKQRYLALLQKGTGQVFDEQEKPPKKIRAKPRRRVVRKKKTEVEDGI